MVKTMGKKMVMSSGKKYSKQVAQFSTNAILGAPTQIDMPMIEMGIPESDNYFSILTTIGNVLVAVKEAIEGFSKASILAKRSTADYIRTLDLNRRKLQVAQEISQTSQLMSQCIHSMSDTIALLEKSNISNDLKVKLLKSQYEILTEIMNDYRNTISNTWYK